LHNTWRPWTNPGAKFGDFSFRRFGFIFYYADRQTDRHIHIESHTDAAKRFTHATVVGVTR